MMGAASDFQELQKRVWKMIVKRGCVEASGALTSMLGTPLSMSGAVMGFLPIHKIPFLAGDPEQIVTGARMVFSGDIGGHMLLILLTRSWEVCKNFLLSKARGASGEELEYSAFAEMANIACSFFIVTLANAADFLIRFTPPEVMSDMTATVLEDTLIQLSEEAADLLTIETTFTTSQAEIKGYLFFIPNPDSVRKITQGFLQANPALEQESAPDGR